MPPIARTAARVLPVSPQGRVLLLQFRNPALPEDWHWISIGGAVDPGETPQEAAVREMREETGIVVSAEDLTRAVHEGSYDFSWDGRDYRSLSTFFAVPLDEDVEVTFDALEPAEVGNVARAGWWTPDDLAVDGSAAEADMPDLMRRAIELVEGAQ